jgi:hypothetical protein
VVAETEQNPLKETEVTWTEQEEPQSDPAETTNENKKKEKTNNEPEQEEKKPKNLRRSGCKTGAVETVESLEDHSGQPRNATTDRKSERNHHHPP